MRAMATGKRCLAGALLALTLSPCSSVHAVSCAVKDDVDKPSLHQAVSCGDEPIDQQRSRVIIQAIIAEVDLNDRLKRGVHTFLSRMGIVRARSSRDNDLTLPPCSCASCFVVRFAGKSTADVALAALRSLTSTKVLSTPYLTVLAGNTARVVTGDQAQVRSFAQYDGSYLFLIEETGIALEVTPRTQSVDSALLSIDVRVSATKTGTVGGANDLTLPIASQHIKSNILIQSGNTLLIAGLIKSSADQTNSDVPVETSIPIAGDFFRQHQDTNKREIIIMITPWLPKI